MASEVIDTFLPEELLRKVNAVAEAEPRTRREPLRERARRYTTRQRTVSDERWRAIQALSSDRASATGVRVGDDLDEDLGPITPGSELSFRALASAGEQRW
jgi:hypothetical protein